MKSIKNSTKRTQTGFTLLEILLVVAAIGILAGIVIFAVNPAKQLGDTRNAQRKVDLNTISNAIYQYAIDHNSDFPVNIPITETEICATDASDCTDMVDLAVLTDAGKYLVAIPTDPAQAAGSSSTGYTIYKDSNNKIHLLAPNTENISTITVVR